MKKKTLFDRTRNFFSSFPVVINGLIIYLAPMSRSLYDGNNQAGFRCNIDFLVDYLIHF